MSYNEKENNPHWNGGITTDGRGRVLLLNRNHHRATHEGYVFEHILIAEQVLGKPIGKEHEIHHVDEIPAHNNNNNLVVCENHAYHLFLHRRARALKACGHVNWEKCRECKTYDNPSIMTVHSRKEHRTVYIHKKCNSQKMKAYYSKVRGGDSHSAS